MALPPKFKGIEKWAKAKGKPDAEESSTPWKTKTTAKDKLLEKLKKAGKAD